MSEGKSVLSTWTIVTFQSFKFFQQFGGGPDFDVCTGDIGVYLEFTSQMEKYESEVDGFGRYLT